MRAKAAVLAKAAGATLGEVLAVAESTAGAIPLQEGLFSRQRGDRAVPIAAGQLELVATVDVTQAIR